MTLKLRNTMMKLLLVFSLTFLILAVTSFFFSTISGTLIPPPTTNRYLTVFRYDFIAMILSLFTIITFVSGISYFLVRYFNHNQSSEISYLMIFLIGLLADSVRIFIISMNIWQSFTELLILMSKAVLFGKTVSVVSLFFIAITNDVTERKNTGRNIAIIIAVSIFISSIFPLNTYKIEPIGMVVIGFKKAYHIARLIFVGATFLAFILNAITKDTSESKQNMLKIAFSYIFVVLGYFILSASDCFFMMITGAILFLPGMSLFLSSIHKLYLWQ
ncbi:MAG: hypothetical protein IJP61_00910 [Treponema sp.]|nr:hypothetical protein [Treponema sp.]